MSSEAITRNDLTAILNEVLPPTPSEYRKLLWSNPSPTSSFSAQTITVPDFSGFDDLEIETRGGSAMTGNTFKYPIEEFKSGNVHWLSYIGQGATGLPSINGRPFNYVSDTQIHFELGAYWNTSGYQSGQAGSGVPMKIYGVKYNRVNPPVTEDATFSGGVLSFGNIRVFFGSVLVASTGTATITFPTGTFSQVAGAIPYCGQNGFGAYDTTSITNLSTASVTLYQYNSAGANMVVAVVVFGLA